MCKSDTVFFCTLVPLVVSHTLAKIHSTSIQNCFMNRNMWLCVSMEVNNNIVPNFSNPAFPKQCLQDGYGAEKGYEGGNTNKRHMPRPVLLLICQKLPIEVCIHMYLCLIVDFRCMIINTLDLGWWNSNSAKPWGLERSALRCLTETRGQEDRISSWKTNEIKEGRGFLCM